MPAMVTPRALRSPLTVEDVVREGHLHAVFQPVVHLATGTVVGFEALARGPRGTTLEHPAALVGAARAAGQLPQLEWACRAVAVRDALAAGMGRDLALFVNVEPRLLDAPVPEPLRALMQESRRRLSVVVELTERALTERPAELLGALERVRSHGWSVALDDVGVDSRSVALMPFIAPEVVKLDLRVVQQRPAAPVAATLSATRAQAERSGTLLVAEGIESPEHLATARALGAEYGQGWLLGRPGPLPRPLPRPTARIAAGSRVMPSDPARTPFEIVGETLVQREASFSLIAAISRELEAQAGRQGEFAVVLAGVGDARCPAPDVAGTYAELARQCALVAALGAGMPAEPAVGVRGVALRHDDPLCGELALAVVSPHFAAVLAARDIARPGGEPRFAYVLTYERDLAVRAATALMTRLAAPRRPEPCRSHPPA